MVRRRVRVGAGQMSAETYVRARVAIPKQWRYEERYGRRRQKPGLGEDTVSLER